MKVLHDGSRLRRNLGAPRGSEIERAAFENELDALAERVKKLEAQMAGMEKSAATELPSETEFEQTLTLMERFFRRFWDLVREFESEKDQPSPEDGTPQRT